MDGDDDRIVPGKGRPMQVRKARKDGWTTKKRGIFLDHFAATSNVVRSAAAAGMTDHSAFALCRRDPEFAEQWLAALRTANVRLTAMLHERSEGPRQAPPEGGTPVPDPSTMDTELALKLLRHHEQRLAGVPRRGGPRPRRATEAETNAAVLKLLSALNKRRGGRG